MDKTPQKDNDLQNKISSLEDEILTYKLITRALNSADIMVSIVKIDTTFVQVNEPYTKTLLYSSDELIRMKGIDLIHPDDKKFLLEKIAHYTKKFMGISLRNFLSGDNEAFSETIEYRVRDKSGTWHWLESVGTIVGGNIYTISKDITERKQTEIDLSAKNKFNMMRAEVWK